MTEQRIIADRYLGIDGGGTKTALLLCDREGNEIRRHYAAACNPMDIGFDTAFGILRNAIGEVCRGIPLSTVSMFAGIAGGGSADAKRRLSEFFGEFGFSAYDNDGDNRSILEAGLGGRDGISVILGTGILAQAKYGGSLARVGGWGYLVDGGGSGYNLGRDALEAYYAAHDGSGNPTCLTALIEEKTACTPEALVGRIYAGGKAFVASFAPLVTEACRSGDDIADAILDRNAACAARLIMACETYFPDETERIPVVLCGGLTADAAYVARITKKLETHQRLAVECMRCEPVLGAVMAAKKLTDTEEISC